MRDPNITPAMKTEELVARSQRLSQTKSHWKREKRTSFPLYEKKVNSMNGKDHYVQMIQLNVKKLSEIARFVHSSGPVLENNYFFFLAL